MFDYAIDKIEGLWRSRTVRWGVLAVAVWLAWGYLLPNTTVLAPLQKAAMATLGETYRGVLISGGMRLVFAFFAVMLWQEVLKAMNNFGRVKGRDIFAIIQTDPKALAFYTGTRQLAVAILIGLVLM